MFQFSFRGAASIARGRGVRIDTRHQRHLTGEGEEPVKMNFDGPTPFGSNDRAKRVIVSRDFANICPSITRGTRVVRVN